MNIAEIFKSSINSILSNKLRSALTMLGVIIGISSVIMVTGVGQGVSRGIDEVFEEMGLNYISIGVNYNTERRAKDYLTLDDLELLKQHEKVKYIAPTSSTWGAEVEQKNTEETISLQLLGTNQDFSHIERIELIDGRFLSAIDVVSLAPVIVIEETAARHVYGRTDVVGETITVKTWRGNADFTVIGVKKSMEIGGVMAGMFYMPTVAYIPITYIMQMYNWQYLDSVAVSLADMKNIDRTVRELTKMLEIKHRNIDAYYIQNYNDMLEEVNKVTGLVTAFIALVAAISLLVGGVGVMNIMLVTVTERTREIGMRKSLGATNGNIRFQFLIEAMFITAIGGIIGLLTGVLGGDIIARVMGLTAYVPPWVVFLATLVSCGVGIIFGVYPAAKAAKLDPIEALRYE